MVARRLLVFGAQRDCRVDLASPLRILVSVRVEDDLMRSARSDGCVAMVW